MRACVCVCARVYLCACMVVVDGLGAVLFRCVGVGGWVEGVELFRCVCVRSGGGGGGGGHLHTHTYLNSSRGQ